MKEVVWRTYGKRSSKKIRKIEDAGCSG